MLGWVKHKLESRLLVEISIASDMQMTPPLWKKVKRNKKLLDEGERGEWKSWLKTQYSENEDHCIWSHPSWPADGETMETVRNFIFGGSKITSDDDCSHEIKTLALWKKSYDQHRQHIKKQSHYFASKGPYIQSYGFSNSHVRMWELDHTEGWVLKNRCLLIVVLEKTLESPLDCKEIGPVNPEGNQPWIFIGKTVAEADALVLWLPDAKSGLLGKDPDAGKGWKQKEKKVAEDEIAG